MKLFMILFYQKQCVFYAATVNTHVYHNPQHHQFRQNFGTLDMLEAITTGYDGF